LALRVDRLGVADSAALGALPRAPAMSAVTGRVGAKCGDSIVTLAGESYTAQQQPSWLQ